MVVGRHIEDNAPWCLCFRARTLQNHLREICSCSGGSIEVILAGRAQSVRMLV